MNLVNKMVDKDFHTSTTFGKDGGGFNEKTPEKGGRCCLSHFYTFCCRRLSRVSKSPPDISILRAPFFLVVFWDYLIY